MPRGVYDHSKNKIWNKGLKGIHLSPETEFKKGCKSVGVTFKKGIHPKNEFKKGSIPPNKGKMKVTSYKKEGATSAAKHQWIIYNYGNPPYCEDCGKVGVKVNRQWNIDWSNIDHKYKRERDNYIGRCKNCHEKYDQIYNNKYCKK